MDNNFMLIPLILLVALPKIAISINKIEKSPREDELIGVGGDNKAAFNFGLPGIDHDK